MTADERRALHERAVAWVERSCAEQGVPVKLSDPVALQRIAAILGEAREARERTLEEDGARKRAVTRGSLLESESHSGRSCACGRRRKRSP